MVASRCCELALVPCIIKGTEPVARQVMRDRASDKRQVTQQELNTHGMTPEYWINAKVILLFRVTPLTLWCLFHW